MSAPRYQQERLDKWRRSELGLLRCRVRGVRGELDMLDALELTRAMPHQIERAEIVVVSGVVERGEAEPELGQLELGGGW